MKLCVTKLLNQIQEKACLMVKKEKEIVIYEISKYVLLINKARVELNFFPSDHNQITIMNGT